MNTTKRNGPKLDIQQFVTWFSLRKEKEKSFRVAKKTSMSAANSCPAVCTRDVINKFSTYSKSEKYHTSQVKPEDLKLEVKERKRNETYFHQTFHKTTN